MAGLTTLVCFVGSVLMTWVRPKVHLIITKQQKTASKFGEFENVRGCDKGGWVIVTHVTGDRLTVAW